MNRREAIIGAAVLIPALRLGSRKNIGTICSVHISIGRSELWCWRGGELNEGCDNDYPLGEDGPKKAIAIAFNLPERK